MFCNRGLHVCLLESNMADLQPGLDQKLLQNTLIFNSVLMSEVCGFPLRGFTSHWEVRTEWTQCDWCMKVSTESSHEGWKTFSRNAYYLWGLPSDHEGSFWLKAVCFHLHNHAADLSCGKNVFPFCPIDPGKQSLPVSSPMGQYYFLHGLFRVTWGNRRLCCLQASIPAQS